MHCKIRRGVRREALSTKISMRTFARPPMARERTPSARCSTPSMCFQVSNRLVRWSSHSQELIRRRSERISNHVDTAARRRHAVVSERMALRVKGANRTDGSGSGLFPCGGSRSSSLLGEDGATVP